MSTLKEITLVAGSGLCAEQVAVQLAASGDTRLLIVTGSDTFPVETGSEKGDHALIEVLTNTRIQACHQTPDHFRIDLTRERNTFSRTVSNIVVAEPEQRKANFSLYHLQASNRVVPLSGMTHRADTMIDEWSNPDGSTTIVFLTSLFAESNPVIAAEIMNAALRLQADSAQNGKAVQTYVLTKNLKVAGSGLEALYRETKHAGTVYIKFTDTVPAIQQKDDAVQITFTDEITGLPFTLTPDITVVDETILPPERINALATVLGLEQDNIGFAQADNVHRQPVLTNRHRILIAGPSRNILGPDDQIDDAANAALAITAWGLANTDRSEGKATIDKGACVRCLTCYRLCPYKAIFLEAYPAVISEACERCGICAAECPQHAIEIRGVGRQEIADRIGLPAENRSGEMFIPFIVAFCCSRSGSQAARLATLMGSDLPPGLKIVEVPCAGGLSPEHIFSGCQVGADGILVLTCHEDNCHSTQGNIHARNRVAHLKDRLSNIGYDSGRIEIQTLASNMGIEFAEITHRFAKKITELGPSELIP